MDFITFQLSINSKEYHFNKFLHRICQAKMYALKNTFYQNFVFVTSVEISQLSEYPWLYSIATV